MPAAKGRIQHSFMWTKEQAHTVKSYQCRPSGCISIPAVMQYLQEIAAAHADQLNFGLARLSEINTYWILSNFKILISRLPDYREQFTLKTWPSGHNRIIATREFTAADVSGNLLFKATSDWMMLDKNSSRPKNLFKLDLKLANSEQRVFSDELLRLQSFTDYSSHRKINVPYSSLDLNAHVNNTEYIRWGLDALRQEFKLPSEVSSLHITFLAEVFENDVLLLNLACEKENLFHIHAKKESDQSDVYLMQIQT